MADVEFTIEAIDKASSAITGIRGAMLSLNQAIGVANQVFRTYNQIIEATIGTYIKYADQVRTLVQLTDESAESMSRLIQVADDYKISAEDLTTASRRLATQGLSLNVETIAELSDKYLALNTGAERQLFLTENLGRASTGWTDIMTQGSEAILARNEAVSASLILDQQAIDKAREYQYAMDDLNDSVMGAKVGLGQLFLPVLMDVTDYVTKSIAGWQMFADTVGLIISTLQNLSAAAIFANLTTTGAVGEGGGKGGVGTGGYVPRPIIAPVVSRVNTTRRAYGGYVSSRYAITGDAMDGRRTGYEELVDFQQKRVYSAPETQAMGAVPGYAMGSGAIDLSYQTIQDLANAVAQKMSGYV